MSEPLSFIPGTKFFAQTSQDNLTDRLRPLILQIHKQTKEGGRFSANVLRALEMHKDIADYFAFDSGAIEETFGLREEYLLPSDNPALELLSFQGSKNSLGGRLAVPDRAPWLKDIHDLFALVGTGRFTERQIARRIDPSLMKLASIFREIGAMGPRRASPFPSSPERDPGIYRLQHASLLFRTRTTGVLIDPNLHSAYEPDNLRSNIARVDLQESVDGILISHSHSDHWQLPTLMTFPSTMPIVVPRVPRRSLLCENMEQRLHGLGFTNVIARDWYSEPIRIGDIQIYVLPFYGEQPLVADAPRHPDLRNWGNTYLIQTEYFTAWILIDSGNDVLGGIQEIAAYIQKKFGGVDFVLSNIRKFQIASPLYITGGDYWLALPTRWMKDFSSLRETSVTLGPALLAEACITAGARYYLPYAHMFGNIGQTGSESELHWIRVLDEEFKRHGHAVPIVPWTIGEGCVIDPGHGLRRIPPPEPAR